MSDDALERMKQTRARLVLLANHARAGLGNHLRDADAAAKGDIWEIFDYHGVTYDVKFGLMNEALPGLGDIASVFLVAEIDEKNVWVILDFYFTARSEFGNQTPHAAWTADPELRTVILTVARSYGKRGDPTR